jgi:hypothetical protein
MTVAILQHSTKSLMAKSLSMPSASAKLHNGRHNRQCRPTGGGYHRLAEDWDEVEAPQGRDQHLEDLCTDYAAYCSGYRVSRP